MGKRETKKETARITRNSYNFYIKQARACVFDNMIAKVQSFVLHDKLIYPGLEAQEIDELKSRRIGLYKRYAYKLKRIDNRKTN